MVKAINSNGVTISVSAGSPTAYLPIGNVTAIRGTGEGAGVVSITNVEDTTTRKLMDLPDEGKVSLDLNYDPDNATHIILRDARRNRTKLEFQIQLTDTTNTLLTFAGYVLAFAMDAAVSQQVRAALTIEVTGATVDGEAPVILVPSIYSALLHFDGVDGATTTTDEYGNAVLISGTNGKLSSTYKKFGTTSLNCMNGGVAGGYARITGPTSLGAAGWTLECWFYADDSVVDYHSRGLIAAINGTGYGVDVYMAGPNLTQPAPVAVQLSLSSNGSSNNIYAASLTTAYNVPTQQWNHLAVCYDSAAGHYYLYVNGIVLHDVTSALAICPITQIYVGRDYANNTYIGWIDEFRFSDSCRYPGGTTFTVPSAAFDS